MTVSSETTRNDYTGNGATTEFAYSFRIWSDTDLLVVTADGDGVETTLELTTDYTVTGAGLTTGGSITLLEPLASGHKLTILSAIPALQGQKLSTQSGFRAEVQEASLDKLTRIAQQNSEKLNRAVLMPITSGDTPPDPAEIVQAGADAISSAAAAALSQSLAASSATAAAASAAALEAASVTTTPLGVDLCHFLRSNTAVGRCYAIKDANRSLFGIGMVTNGYNAAEFEFTADVDGLWRVRYGHTNQIREPSTTVQASNCRDASNVTVDIGTITTSNDNKYFTGAQAGYKFDLAFTGTGLIFRYYSNNQGGLWKVTVDGAIEIFVSCYSADVVSDNKTVICSGLASGAHTAVFEFVGDDPDHVPSGGAGTGRGWFKYDNGSAPTFTTGLIITGDEMAILWMGRTLTLTGVLEFAVNATANGSGITSAWVPFHTTLDGPPNGSVVVSSRRLFIDGAERPDDLSDWTSGTEFVIEDFLIVQDYTAYSKYDSGKVYPLWTGTLAHRFNRDGLTISHAYKTVTDVLVSDGYSAMLAGKIDALGEVRIDNGYSRAMVAPVGSDIEYEPGYCRSALMFNETTGDAAAISVGSWLDSTCEGRAWKDAGRPTLLTERVDGIQKLYFIQSGEDLVIPSGTILKSTATIFHVKDFPLKALL